MFGEVGLGINVFAGFPYADTAITGVSVSGASFGAVDVLEQALRDVARCIWQQRESCLNPALDMSEVLQRIEKEALAGPIVLAEPADNIGGGAPGDHTDALKKLLASPFLNSVAVICDPEAVRQCNMHDIGAQLSLEIGGHSDQQWSQAIMVDAELCSVSDGRFTLEDSQSHMASFAGQHICMGDCAVIRLSNATILLTTVPTAPMDLGQLRSQGIYPEQAYIILAKAAVSHRRAYDPIVAHSFSINSRGPCSEDIGALPYTKLKHPMYPIHREQFTLVNINQHMVSNKDDLAHNKSKE